MSNTQNQFKQFKKLDILVNGKKIKLKDIPKHKKETYILFLDDTKSKELSFEELADFLNKNGLGYDDSFEKFCKALENINFSELTRQLGLVEPEAKDEQAEMAKAEAIDARSKHEKILSESNTICEMLKRVRPDMFDPRNMPWSTNTKSVLRGSDLFKGFSVESLGMALHHITSRSARYISSFFINNKRYNIATMSHDQFITKRHKEFAIDLFEKNYSRKEKKFNKYLGVDVCKAVLATIDNKADKIEQVIETPVAKTPVAYIIPYVENGNHVTGVLFKLSFDAADIAANPKFIDFPMKTHTIDNVSIAKFDLLEKVTVTSPNSVAEYLLRNKCIPQNDVFIRTENGFKAFLTNKIVNESDLRKLIKEREQKYLTSFDLRIGINHCFVLVVE